MNLLSRSFDRCRQSFYRLFYYSCLLLFANGIWLTNAICWVLRPTLGRTGSDRWVRWLIFHEMRLYLSFMEGSGALITNRDVLARIPLHGKGHMLIANHPSILDAPIILSMLPDVLCVFKSRLTQSLLMPNTARMAGYLSSDMGLDMIRSMEAALKAGKHVLIFPEGTRTSGPVVDAFNAAYALAALRANAPIQLIAIHAHNPVLSKRQHFLDSGRLPARFELTVGPRIEPGDFTTSQQINAAVHNWYTRRLQPGAKLQPQYLPLGIEWQEQDDTCTVGQFRIPAAPWYCGGHMPDWPIVPAYVQMAWAREIIAMTHDQSPHACLNLTRWKFLAPVKPEDRITFEIKRVAVATWQVVFRRADERVSTGRIARQHQIT